MKKILILIIVILCIITLFIAGMIILNKGTVRNDFYARIKNINEYNGTITLLTEGIKGNDINHQGEFIFSINETEILYNDKIVDTTYLKVGQTISIVYYGAVMETYPARLTDVTRIVILDSEV